MTNKLQRVKDIIEYYWRQIQAFGDNQANSSVNYSVLPAEKVLSEKVSSGVAKSVEQIISEMSE